MDGTNRTIALEASPLSSSSAVPATPRNPFDWLQGSLFFGAGARNSGNSIGSVDDGNTNDTGGGDGGWSSNAGTITGYDDSNLVDRCTDVYFLLNGLSEYLHSLISSQKQKQLAQGSGEFDAKTQAIVSLTPSTETTESTGAHVLISQSDKIAMRLSRLRFLLYDERRITSQQPLHLIETKKICPVVAEATVNAFSGNQLENLMPLLLQNMVILPFESRKHVAAIFNYLLVCGLEGIDAPLYDAAMAQFVSYIEMKYEQIMTLIVQGHNVSEPGVTPDIALHFGSMYRSGTRHANLYQQLVGTRNRAEQFVYPFLDEYVHMANFEISSDAMESLRAAFAANNTDRNIAASNVDEKSAEQWNRSRISDLAAEFLNRDYDAIWDERFTPKLLSDTANYMSRRVALQILSTVLLTRSNYSIMIRYVASRSNLIVVMHLLRDTSPHITLDAFHVFKVFVANPNKPPEIVKILHDNKTKLCAYLMTLHQEKEENDTQFRDEKALIIATIDAQ